MMEYGVRKLVAINTGNYLYANIDLSKPVHLAAPNNRGKSTLVNALQFLYVDDFSRMKFGRRTHDDTRKHYFGEDRSYLIFECLTTSGIQCMLVRGLSNLRGGAFERYVYDGEFSETDYLDDGEIRVFEDVRTRLADRHLARVNNADLWQVLAGTLPNDDRKSIPRFNILPIRRRDEYTAFRDIFVRLLSLTNADARTLRQLVIESHAREVGERKIDVAAEYKDEFERAERSENELTFIRSVTEEIDNGRQLRLDIQALTDKLNAAAPSAWNDARRCQRFIEAEDGRLKADMDRLEREQKDTPTRKDSLLTTRGRLEVAQETVDREWSTLHEAQEKWSVYSSDFIKAMRQNVEEKSDKIVELKRHLEQAKNLDVDSMRRRVVQLERQIATDRKALELWERTVVAELRRRGVSDSELDSAFRVANPELLKLIVGENVIIRDADAVIERIHAIADRIRDGKYADEAMEADLDGVAGPDGTIVRDAAHLKNQIAINQEDLRQQTVRLRTAEDQVTARARLVRLVEEVKEQSSELAAYDAYTRAWSGRADLENRLNDAREEVANVNQDISELEEQLRTQAEEARRVQKELQVLREQRDKLAAAVRDYQEQVRRVGFDGLLASDSDKEVDDAARPQSLQRFVESVTSKLSKLTTDLRRVEASRSQVKQLQEAIAAKSRQVETQQRYFNDEDEEWELLIETCDSLPQLEEATAKNWDALFTTLGARLNAIVTAVSRIKTAVERINRGLREYQVSNLRAVDIRVEEEHDTFPAVEALSRQGSLFQDRDAIDIAKKRLRRMIERNETIELESLFELRIQIQETDGTWHQAASLDEIGSTGTGMTAKAMIFIQLVRAIAGNEKYRLHFYIDGLGELDDQNLEATAAMAVSKGIVPITADPRLHLGPLAHPEVTVYSLGQDLDGRFYIDRYRTYQARRVRIAEATHE